MCHEQQTCLDGRHRLISLDNSLTGARCLSQHSAAISALWVTAAHSPDLGPGASSKSDYVQTKAVDTAPGNVCGMNTFRYRVLFEQW